MAEDDALDDGLYDVLLVGCCATALLPSALNGRRATRSTVAKLPSPLPIGAGERELLERVVGFYAQTLKECPEALAVLERRGLGELALIEEFRLGYANRTLGYRLPAKNRKPGAELRGKLQELGVFRATGHEHLSGSLVIPVCDANGEVVQLYGRKLRDDLNHRGSSRHLYLPGPRRGIFNAKALAACDGELIVCESLIDALTFWRHGLRHVTAAFGADGFTDELHAALTDAGIGRVLIAFDRDDAGDRGAAGLAKRLGADGIECFRVLFPAGQDSNSFATSVEEPAGALAQLLREAVWIGAGEPAARPAPAPSEEPVASEPVVAPPAPVESERPGGEEEQDERDVAEVDLSSAAKAARSRTRAAYTAGNTSLKVRSALADEWSMRFPRDASMIAGGLLAAASIWALPSFALQAHPSGRTCHRYRSSGDRDARMLARDAEVAAETIATDHQGTYTSVSPGTIHALEPEIPITPEQARHEHRGAYLLSASGTTTSYALTTRSQNGDTYTLSRESSGTVKRDARVCGKTRSW